MQSLSKWSCLTVLLLALLSSSGLEKEILRANPLPSFSSVQMESFILPAFQLNTLDQRVVTQKDLNQGPVVLAFILPNCLACKSVIAMLRSAAHDLPQVAYVLATKEDSPELRAMLETFSSFSFPVLLDMDTRLAQLFAVDQAPTVYLIRDGVVLKRMNWSFIFEELFAQLDALAQGKLEPASPLGVRAGAAAPDLTGDASTGGTVSLAELTKPLLIVFYSELCGASQELLLKLTEVKQAHPKLEILLVAANGRAESASPWTALLDRDLRLFARYGITGTPTIVLIDEKGVVRWLQVGYRADFTEVLSMVLRES